MLPLSPVSGCPPSHRPHVPDAAGQLRPIPALPRPRGLSPAPTHRHRARGGGDEDADHHLHLMSRTAATGRGDGQHAAGTQLCRSGTRRAAPPPPTRQRLPGPQPSALRGDNGGRRERWGRSAAPDGQCSSAGLHCCALGGKRRRAGTAAF